MQGNGHTIGWNENMRSKLSLVGLKIVKMDTRFRAAVPVQERLAVTLRFLATGDLYTICNIISKFLNNQSGCN